MRRNYQRWEFQKYTDSLLAQEKSSVTLQRGEDLQVALAFPNNYELGMANLGFQTVYRLFN